MSSVKIIFLIILTLLGHSFLCWCSGRSFLVSGFDGRSDPEFIVSVSHFPESHEYETWSLGKLESRRFLPVMARNSETHPSFETSR